MRKIPRLGKIELDSFSLDLDYFFGHEYDEIGQASIELPAVIEWVNSQLQGLTENKIIAKQRIKEVEAETYFNFRRGGFEGSYPGKPTDAAVERAVALSDKVRAAYERYAVLTGWVDRLTRLTFSLQAKLDLVRSSEATRRSQD